MIRLVVACLLIVAAGASATDVIRPGDSRVDVSRVIPYVTMWNVTVVTPDGKAVDGGTWRDRVRLMPLNGRRVLLREQIVDAPPPRRPEIFSVWVDATTMAPVATQYVGVAGRSVHHEFDGATDFVRELSPADGFKFTEQRLPLEAPAFDFFGGLFGLLLRAMPLEVGKTLTFTTLTGSTSPPYTADLTAKVVRSDQTAAGYLGTVDTLVTEVEAPGDVHYTFWIGSQPPYIIKLELRRPDGSKLVWTLPAIKPTQ